MVGRVVHIYYIYYIIKLKAVQLARLPIIRSDYCSNDRVFAGWSRLATNIYKIYTYNNIAPMYKHIYIFCSSARAAPQNNKLRYILRRVVDVCARIAHALSLSIICNYSCNFLYFGAPWLIKWGHSNEPSDRSYGWLNCIRAARFVRALYMLYVCDRVDTEIVRARDYSIITRVRPIIYKVVVIGSSHIYTFGFAVASSKQHYRPEDFVFFL